MNGLWVRIRRRSGRKEWKFYVPEGGYLHEFFAAQETKLNSRLNWSYSSPRKALGETTFVLATQRSWIHLIRFYCIAILGRFQSGCDCYPAVCVQKGPNFAWCLISGDP